MSETFEFVLCTIGFGLLVIIGIVIYAFYIYQRIFKDDKCPFYCLLDKTGLSSQSFFTEFLERRNEFWYAFGQTIVVVMIVIVLTVLLIIGKISAEAGLPIISGLSGFAIAKNVSSVHKNKEALKDETQNR
jgi:ABC-type sugar transport system permease subunit